MKSLIQHINESKLKSELSEIMNMLDNMALQRPNDELVKAIYNKFTEKHNQYIVATNADDILEYADTIELWLKCLREDHIIDNMKRTALNALNAIKKTIKKYEKYNNYAKNVDYSRIGDLIHIGDKTHDYFNGKKLNVKIIPIAVTVWNPEKEMEPLTCKFSFGRKLRGDEDWLNMYIKIMKDADYKVNLDEINEGIISITA